MTWSVAEENGRPIGCTAVGCTAVGRAAGGREARDGADREEREEAEQKAERADYSEDPLGEDIVPRREEPRQVTATDLGDLAYRQMREIASEMGVSIWDLLHLVRLRAREDRRKRDSREKIRKEDERVWNSL